MQESGLEDTHAVIIIATAKDRKTSLIWQTWSERRHPSKTSIIPRPTLLQSSPGIESTLHGKTGVRFRRGNLESTFWTGLHKGAYRETTRGKKRTPSVLIYQGLLVVTANQNGGKLCMSMMRGYHPSWHELSKIHDPLLRTGVLDIRRAQEAQHQL